MTIPGPKQPAQRTYASLMGERGFCPEDLLSRERWTVSICPERVRSYWRLVDDRGHATFKDALYEEVGL